MTHSRFDFAPAKKFIKKKPPRPHGVPAHPARAPRSFVGDDVGSLITPKSLRLVTSSPCPVRAPPKSARGLAQSKTLRVRRARGVRASVLDCGSPLPLFPERKLNFTIFNLRPPKILSRKNHPAVRQPGAIKPAHPLPNGCRATRKRQRAGAVQDASRHSRVAGERFASWTAAALRRFSPNWFTPAMNRFVVRVNQFAFEVNGLSRFPNRLPSEVNRFVREVNR